MSSSLEAREEEGAGRRQLVAALIAVGIHGLLLFGVTRLHGSVPVPETKIVVDIVDAPAPVPVHEATPPPPDEPMQTSGGSRRRGLRPKERTSAIPPAGTSPVASDQAGPAGVPVDLTDEVPVVGTGGGRTGTPAGSGDSPGPGSGNDGKKGFGSPGAPRDLSAPVSLQGESWACPWPPEADSERIDEQTVVIRVVVDPEGIVEATELVVEPGHGFGKAAVACAHDTRFTPARDRAGKPVRARSPPIRVRFTR
jgi:protein TonB